MSLFSPPVSNASVAVAEFLRHPSMVGSAFPASKRMVRRMLAPFDWSNIDAMVEYGPGTGRFTFAALARMKPHAKLIAIETGKDLAEHLSSTSHDSRLVVVQGSADDVLAILADNNLDKADCILSGLPFSTIEQTQAERVIFASRAALGLCGLFAAYQMRTAIEPVLRRAFVNLHRGFEWWNIPPCHLYWARGGTHRL